MANNESIDLTAACESVRDWVYENYRASYVLGTGALALMGYLCDPKKRKGLALGGYAAALAVGLALEPCVNVEDQRYGPSMSRGRFTKRCVALTFDDGPHGGNTPAILDVLAEEKVPATFFCVGANALRHPKLVRRMVAEGHLVGSHSYSHRNLLFTTPAQSKDEIAAGARALEKVTGTRPVWFRPPYGMRYPWTLLQARAAGMSTVLWSNCPRDWQCPGYKVIVRRVLDSILPGDIVLLHDGGGDRSQTVRALRLLIRALRMHGYSFVRVDKL